MRRSPSVRRQESLASRYRRPYRTYIRHRGTDLVASLRAHAVARSPLHYERDDMRRQYDWRRAVVTAVLTMVLLALAGRLALNGVLVALFAPDAADLVLLNAGLTLAAGFGFVMLAVARLIAAPPSRTRGLERTFAGRRPVASLLVDRDDR
ncbi:hypothetical protein [Halomarina pelagica]|uniref:hypothetical protein n=1 Tax=Halomarina pelagica TaxID=2961599 RepID=UPI0020C1CA00|nr:hypothetical protein [Halomarina sp. BND7]